MRVEELIELNWETITIDDLKKAHDLMGLSFEFNNGKLTKVYINEEELS